MKNMRIGRMPNQSKKFRREEPERTLKRRLHPVLLDTGRAQSGKSVLIDRHLPAQELVDRQRVAVAGLVERQEAAADGSDDLCLAADDPALRRGRRQIGDCQRTAVRPDDILDPWPMDFRHIDNSRTRLTNTRERLTLWRLRFT